MENLTHTLVGAVLSKAGLEKEVPLATPTLLIAANLPDIDVFTGILNNNYYDVHRGVTHGAAGILVFSFGLSGILWALLRSKLLSAAESPKYFRLWCVSFLGLVTHPFLDYLNDYGLRPWLPFNERKYYGDLVSIVDPWLWIIFGSALVVLTTSRWKKLAWLLLGLILVSLIALGAGPKLAVTWTGLLAVTLAVAWYLRRKGLRVARLSLMIFFVYLAWMGVTRERGLQSAYAMAPMLASQPVQKVDLLPVRPGNPWDWTVVMEVNGGFYVGDIQLWNRPRRLSEYRFYPKNWDDPCYQKACSQREMASLVRFARFPSVDVQTSTRSCTVFLRDLRYARRSIPGWGVARATVSWNE